jgi:hypothetical protein
VNFTHHLVSHLQRPPRRRHARRAISLIEVATAMAAGAVLLGVTAMALVAVQQADRRWVRQSDQQRAGELMFDRLRQDVHAASSYSWSAADRVLRLKYSGGAELTYRRLPRRWERRRTPSAVDRARTELTAAYPTSRSVEWRVTPPAGIAGDLMHVESVRVTPSPSKAGGQTRTEEMVATVGRDQRLLNP